MGRRKGHGKRREGRPSRRWRGNGSGAKGSEEAGMKAERGRKRKGDGADGTKEAGGRWHGRRGVGEEGGVAMTMVMVMAATARPWRVARAGRGDEDKGGKGRAEGGMTRTNRQRVIRARRQRREKGDGGRSDLRVMSWRNAKKARKRPQEERRAQEFSLTCKKEGVAPRGRGGEEVEGVECEGRREGRKKVSAEQGRWRNGESGVGEGMGRGGMGDGGRGAYESFPRISPSEVVNALSL
ncbi:hypothetical protein BJY52DRAFT_1223370 [Lactarius psammicola]|nr:hypothetical protein BJY52DRAFT_1223370 [Lactarius psammicola]